MAEIFSRYIGKDIDSGKVADAREWFREKASEVDKVDTEKLIKKSTSEAVSRIRLGQLYLFRYDPKLRDQLPYYDIFPLIFVIQKTQEGFLGLNLHYLPYVYRARLMDALYDFVTGEEDLKRLKITYQILKSTAKLRYYKPCLKHYLNNHVRSRFIHVSTNEWDTAVFLPLQRFVKAKTQQVHRDSVQTIRKSNLRGIKA